MKSANKGQRSPLLFSKFSNEFNITEAVIGDVLERRHCKKFCNIHK